MEKEIIRVSFFDREDKKPITTYEAQKRENLLDLMRKAGVHINATCKGAGTCGKCRVVVGEKETLACQTFCEKSIDVYVDKKNEMKIMLDMQEREFVFDPIVKKANVKIEEATLERSFDDEFAVCKSLCLKNLTVPQCVLQKLPQTLRKNKYEVSLIYDSINNTLLDIEEKNDNDIYALVCDLGTTTVACKMYSLTTGEEVSKYAALNKQDLYGHDVMSRIHHCYTDAGLSELRGLAYQTINEIIETMLKRTGITKERIYSFTVTGNSTMLHFFLGVSVESLAVLPFTPAFKNVKFFSADNLSINKNALCYTTPIIGGFVGGDTVSCLLASGIFEKKETSMIVDIGTNGESAIITPSFMLASSSPAGPAFEGAEIKHGMRGTEGAIEYVSYNGEDIEIKVIGGVKPIGICGSGLIDAVAAMIEAGVLEETGELISQSKLSQSVSGKIKMRVSEIEGSPIFKLTEYIHITQKDIRAFQLAKGAVASIMELLIKEANVAISEIDKIYIAGAFGNYIRIESAIKIGLIPKVGKEKVVFIGNAALNGAMMACLSRKCFDCMLKISNETKNMEFGGTPTFQMVFADCLMLE